ncbi:MAG: hypothetical protein AAF125_19525, partial [Chloroflexota bacterium]
RGFLALLTRYVLYHIQCPQTAINIGFQAVFAIAFLPEIAVFFVPPNSPIRRGFHRMLRWRTPACHEQDLTSKTPVKYR